MEVQVTLNGEDITNYVISFSREQMVCTGVGNLEVVLANTVPCSFNVWDVAVTYEGGEKTGTYYICDINKEEKSGEIQLTCQDGSKKLTDNFISEQLDSSQLTHAREWIIRYFEDSGVPYDFNVGGRGAPVAPFTEMGINSAYDMITLLLQQSGWYLYFNPDGVAIVGDIQRSLENPAWKVTDEQITEIQIARNDNSLRNRAVVWGGLDYQSMKQIFADVSVNTPWNYDNKDKRAVVLANSLIHSNGVANQLAHKILQTFAKINEEKVVTVPGPFNVHLGDLVFINSKTYCGIGLVTSVQATVSKSGHLVTFTVDQRCPRLFAYFSFGQDPYGNVDCVYIGTKGHGVYKKPLDGAGFSPFNAGLQNLYIHDLYITNGIFVCVADDGYAYTRKIGDTAWTKYHHGGFIDLDVNVYFEEDVRAVSCTIDRTTSDIYIGYNAVTNIRSWVVKLSGQGILQYNNQVVVNNEQKYLIQDLDRDGKQNVIVAMCDISIAMAGNYREISPQRNPDPLCFPYGPQDTYSGLDFSNGFPTASGVALSGLVTFQGYISNHSGQTNYVQDGDHIYVATYGGGFQHYDLTPSGVTTLSKRPNRTYPLMYGEERISFKNAGSFDHNFLHMREDRKTFDLIQVYHWNDDKTKTDGVHLKHYSLNFTDEQCTTLSGVELLSDYDIFNPREYYNSNIQIGRMRGIHIAFVDGVVSMLHYGVRATSQIPGTESFIQTVVHTISYDVRRRPATLTQKRTFCFGCGLFEPNSGLQGGARITVDLVRSSELIPYFPPGGPKSYFCFIEVYNHEAGLVGPDAPPPNIGKNLLVIQLDVDRGDSRVIGPAPGSPVGPLHQISMGRVSSEMKGVFSTDYGKNWFKYLGSVQSTGESWVRCCLGITESYIVRCTETVEENIILVWGGLYDYQIWDIRVPDLYAVPRFRWEGIDVARGHNCKEYSRTPHPLAELTNPNIEHIAPLVVYSGRAIHLKQDRNDGGYYLYDTFSGEPIVYYSGMEGFWFATKQAMSYVDMLDGTIYFDSGYSIYGVDTVSGVFVKHFKGGGTGPSKDGGHNFANGYLFRGNDFYRLRDTISGIDVSPILRNQQYEFTVVDVEHLPAKVDCSKDSPTVVYTLPSGATLPSGFRVFSGWYGIFSHTKIHNPEFTGATVLGQTSYDERVFDLSNVSGFPYILGPYPSGFNRYVGIPIVNALVTANVNFDGSFGLLKAFSGATSLKAIETSNNGLVPYFFVYEDTPIRKFHQFTPADLSWHDYSAGLPASEVTVIRVDDRL
jgi:hypothetical protein